MQQLRDLSNRFARDASGATSIEYGLIAVLVSIGALAGMSSLGSGVADNWGNTANKVAAAMK